MTGSLEMEVCAVLCGIDIRPMAEPDWGATWSVIAPGFREGDTYPFASLVAPMLLQRQTIDSCSLR